MYREFSAALLTGLFVAGSAFCSAASDLHDRELSSVEREVVSLADAMPAEKYDFAPSSGSFNGVRPFRLQMTHLATVIYEVSAGILGEKMPVDAGKNENGSEALKTKDDVVQYLKAAFTYGHKAMHSLTDENVMGMVDSPFGKKASRAYLADITIWHSYDHYGQSVVYARMSGIVPPASR